MRPAATLLPLAAAAALAQSPAPTPPPASEQAIAAFAVRPPDEASPFFSVRELARQEMRASATREVQGAVLPDGNAEYPKVRDTNQTAIGTFTGFFTGMFSSVRLGLPGKASQPASLRLDPSDFSLSDRREVEAIYEVRNEGRRILRLDYPTAQRIEILTRDSTGEVVDRWSDDRAFEEQEGVVFINPGERISYAEKIPTREMKAGETYFVEAEVVGYPDFNASKRVDPAP